MITICYYIDDPCELAIAKPQNVLNHGYILYTVTINLSFAIMIIVRFISNHLAAMIITIMMIDN
jgi:hypothetical protein